MMWHARTPWMSLLLVFAALAPVGAQLSPGVSTTPLAGPPPTAPGLYAGVEDREGVAVSWLRVVGIKDRGNLLPFVRGTWGNGVVDVPLTDTATMECYYSEGRIQADVQLLAGEKMHLQLENPFTELQGFWRGNAYSIPLAGIRRVWFRYLTQSQVESPRYGGPPVSVAVEGVVTSMELHGTGGYLTLETPQGEAVNMRFEYSRLHSGIGLLLNKAPWLVGRTVRVLYRLSSIEGDRAMREIRDVQMTR